MRVHKSRVYQHLKISPDGRYVAFITNELGQHKVWLYDFLDKYKKDDVDKGDSVTIKSKWDYIIINESEIPRHYMTPNVELIRAAVKAQGKLAEQSIRGIEVKELKELAVRVR